MTNLLAAMLDTGIFYVTAAGIGALHGLAIDIDASPDGEGSL